MAKTLAIFIVLYALQALYSEDYSKGLQEVCFFLVPFTLAYILLRELPWDRRLLVWALILITGEAIAFVLIGSVEYVSRSLFWNQAVIRSNEFHTYFRVNSIFWDPNIYGRYLALVLVVVTAAMMWVRERRAFWLLCGAILILWLGLAQTFSQSSFIALLAGLAVLAALRWSLALDARAGRASGWSARRSSCSSSAARARSPRTASTSTPRGRSQPGLRRRRTVLRTAAVGLWLRLLPAGLQNHLETEKKAPVTISHTEPVTVAAEQGLIGLAAYIALVVVSLWTMGAGLWARGPDRDPLHVFIARAAILAAFVALLVHTMAYAGFFQDPITWVLMAVGASLAASHRRSRRASVARVQSTPRSCVLDLLGERPQGRSRLVACPDT